MLHEFKRKFHLYSQDRPGDSDNFEWLAIMQHHGCPTRLLDFTYSPYVAAFFALIDSKGPAALWCIDWTALRDRAQARFNLNYQHGKDLRDVMNLCHIELLNRCIANRDHKVDPAIIPVEPKRLTLRIARQKGLFLVPTQPEAGFMQNLCEVLELSRPDAEFIPVSKLPEPKECPVVKAVIPDRILDSGLRSLMQMNVSLEGLFPGLDGLAKSLVEKAFH